MAKKSLFSRKSLFSKSEVNLFSKSEFVEKEESKKASLKLFRWKKKKRADSSEDGGDSRAEAGATADAESQDGDDGTRRKTTLFGSVLRSKKGLRSSSETDLRKPKSFMASLSWKKKKKRPDLAQDQPSSGDVPAGEELITEQEELESEPGTSCAADQSPPQNLPSPASDEGFMPVDPQTTSIPFIDSSGSDGEADHMSLAPDNSSVKTDHSPSSDVIRSLLSPHARINTHQSVVSADVEVDAVTHAVSQKDSPLKHEDKTHSSAFTPPGRPSRSQRLSADDGGNTETSRRSVPDVIVSSRTTRNNLDTESDGNPIVFSSERDVSESTPLSLPTHYTSDASSVEETRPEISSEASVESHHNSDYSRSTCAGDSEKRSPAQPVCAEEESRTHTAINSTAAVTFDLPPRSELISLDPAGQRGRAENMRRPEEETISRDIIESSEMVSDAQQRNHESQKIMENRTEAEDVHKVSEELGGKTEIMNRENDSSEMDSDSPQWTFRAEKENEEASDSGNGNHSVPESQKIMENRKEAAYVHEVLKELEEKREIVRTFRAREELEETSAFTDQDEIGRNENHDVLKLQKIMENRKEAADDHEVSEELGEKTDIIKQENNSSEKVSDSRKWTFRAGEEYEEVSAYTDQDEIARNGNRDVPDSQKIMENRKEAVGVYEVSEEPEEKTQIIKWENNSSEMDSETQQRNHEPQKIMESRTEAVDVHEVSEELGEKTEIINQENEASEIDSGSPQWTFRSGEEYEEVSAYTDQDEIARNGNHGVPEWQKIMENQTEAGDIHKVSEELGEKTEIINQENDSSEMDSYSQQWTFRDEKEYGEPSAYTDQDEIAGNRNHDIPESQKITENRMEAAYVHDVSEKIEEKREIINRDNKSSKIYSDAQQWRFRAREEYEEVSAFTDQDEIARNENHDVLKLQKILENRNIHAVSEEPEEKREAQMFEAAVKPWTSGGSDVRTGRIQHLPLLKPALPVDQERRPEECTPAPPRSAESSHLDPLRPSAPLQRGGQITTPQDNRSQTHTRDTEPILHTPQQSLTHTGSKTHNTHHNIRESPAPDQLSITPGESSKAEEISENISESPAETHAPDHRLSITPGERLFHTPSGLSALIEEPDAESRAESDPGSDTDMNSAVAVLSTKLSRPTATREARDDGVVVHKVSLVSSDKQGSFGNHESPGGIGLRDSTELSRASPELERRWKSLQSSSEIKKYDGQQSNSEMKRYNSLQTSSEMEYGSLQSSFDMQKYSSLQSSSEIKKYDSVQSGSEKEYGSLQSSFEINKYSSLQSSSERKAYDFTDEALYMPSSNSYKRGLHGSLQSSSEVKNYSSLQSSSEKEYDNLQPSSERKVYDFADEALYVPSSHIYARGLHTSHLSSPETQPFSSETDGRLSNRSEVQLSSGRSGVELSLPAEGERERGQTAFGSQAYLESRLMIVEADDCSSDVFQATRVELVPSPTEPEPDVLSPSSCAEMDNLVDTLKSMERPVRPRVQRTASNTPFFSLPPIDEDAPISPPTPMSPQTPISPDPKQFLNGLSSLPPDLGLSWSSPKDMRSPLAMMKEQQFGESQNRGLSLPLRASALNSIVLRRGSLESLSPEESPTKGIVNGGSSRLESSFFFQPSEASSRSIFRAASLPEISPGQERMSSAAKSAEGLLGSRFERFSFLASPSNSLSGIADSSRISVAPSISREEFSHKSSIDLYRPESLLQSPQALQRSSSLDGGLLIGDFQVTPKPEPEPDRSLLLKYRAFPDAYLTKEKEHGKLNPRPGKMLIYERPGLSGERIEVRGDVVDATPWEFEDTISVRVIRGGWVFYEKPNFKGEKIALDEGDIELTNPFGAPDEEEQENGATAEDKGGEEQEHKPQKRKTKFVIGSIRRAVRDYSVPEISLFPEENAEGKKVTFRDTSEDARIFGFPIKANSIIINAGLWLVFAEPFFQGVPRVLEVGGFPSPAAWGVTHPYVGSVHPMKIGEPRVENLHEPKLVLYEKPYFTGKSREIYSSMRDFLTRVDRQQTLFMFSAGSIKVIGGCWVGYEKEGFRGHQYLLEEGEYHDWRVWGGVDAELRSARVIHTDLQEPLLVLYGLPEEEKDEGEERTFEVSEAVPDVELFSFGTNTRSIHVLSGAWVAYSHVDFSGNQYVLEKGFYSNCGDWGSGDHRICSLQPILTAPSDGPSFRHEVLLYSEPDFQGLCRVCHQDQPSLQESLKVQSCRVMGGSWVLYDEEKFAGNMCVLSEGNHPNRTSMGLAPDASVRSARAVPMTFTVPSVSLFGLECFEGREVTLDTQVSNMQEEGFNTHFLSVRVNSGCWVLCEHSNYRGRQVLLEPIEITNWLKFSSVSCVGSLYPVRQKQRLFRIRNRATGHCVSVQGGVEDMKTGRVVASEQVEGMSDVWLYQDGLLKNKLARSMSLQVMGKVESGAKVVLWTETRVPLQTWSAQVSGAIASITFPGMVLDVKGGKTYDKDHLVIREENEELSSQQWELEFI